MNRVPGVSNKLRIYEQMDFYAGLITISPDFIEIS